MRKLVLLALALVLALGVFAVSAQDDLASIDPTGATISYWHQYNSGAQLDTMNAFIADFNASNQWGITVEGLPQGNYGDISGLMNSAIVSGELPNLVAAYPNNALSYDLEGVVVDLEPYYNDAAWGLSDEEKANLNQTALDAYVFEDGRRLAWTVQYSANVLAVNNTLLADLGYENGLTSIEDFKAAACAAAASGKTGAEGAAVQGYPIVPDASQFESFVAGIGGSIWADGAWDFTNDESVAVLQLMADLYTEGCGYIPAERFGNTADFSRGLNPMALGSSAGIPFITNDIEAAGGVVTDWSVTTTPPAAAGDTPTLQLFTQGLVIIDSTPEENLATWLFVKYLTEAEQQAAWTNATLYFPTNNTVDVTELAATNPYIASVYELVTSGSVNLYQSPSELSYGAVRDILATGLADVTANGMDVAEVAQRMTDEANAALNAG